MKKDIHPNYYDNATITCACGAVYHTGATQETLATELCSACHPFYTGIYKLMDTGDRVSKFKAKLAKHEKAKQTQGKGKKVKAAARKAKKTTQA